MPDDVYGVMTRTERSGRIMATAGVFLIAGFIGLFLGADQIYLARQPAENFDPLLDPQPSRIGGWVSVVDATFLLATAFLLPNFRIGWWMAIVHGVLWAVVGLIVIVLASQAALHGFALQVSVGGALLYTLLGLFTIWACASYRLTITATEDADSLPE